MTNYIVTDSQMISLADAIREKGGTSASLTFPNGMISAISDIQGGGPFDLTAYFNGTLSEVDDINGDIKSIGKFISNSDWNYYWNQMSNGYREICFNSFSELSYINLPSCSMISLGGINYCSSINIVSLPQCTSIGIYGISYVSIDYLYAPNVKNITYIVGRFKDISISSELNMCGISNYSYVNENVWSSVFVSASGNNQYFLVSWTGMGSNFTSTYNTKIICTGAFMSNYTLSGYISNNNVERVCDYATGVLSSGRWQSTGTFGNSTHFSSISLPNCSWIGNYAFCMSSQANQTISYLNIQNCKHIGQNAFTPVGNYSNTRLTSIILDLPEYIGSYAFNNYNNLNIDTIDFTNCIYMGSSAFGKNSTITSIPSTITSNCSYLAGFCDLPNLPVFNCDAGGKVYISSTCSQLSEINLPYATYLNASMLSQLISLSTPNLEDGSLYGLSLISELSLPNFKTGSIGAMSLMTELSLPNYELISTTRAINLANLTSLNISNLKYVNISTVSGPILQCPNITSLNLSNLEYISNWNATSNYYYGVGFWNMSNLQTINLDKLSYCGGLLFSNCSQLSEISLPKLKSLYGQQNGYAMISNCQLITSLDLPELEYVRNGYTSTGSNIGYPAMLGGANVQTVKLYKLQSINSCLFMYMSKLESVYLYMSYVCQFESTNNYTSLFYNTPIQYSTYLGYFGSIYVPASLYNEYKTHTQWRYWSNRFASIPE